MSGSKDLGSALADITLVPQEAQPATSISAGGGEPADWNGVADDVLALIRERLEPAIEVAANKLYEHVLSDVQEYLLDNAKFNISQTLEGAERQAFADRQENKALKEVNACMLTALRHAERFIVNGVDLGFIRMPDPDTPDTAHDTLPAIRAAIAKATGQ